MQVQGDRDFYAGQLKHSLSGEPIAVLIVREARFDNPNVMMTDLIELLNKNREYCKAVFESAADISLLDRLSFILLARTALPTVQLTSPAQIPDWVPVFGGRTVLADIQDLTWAADAPLDGREAKVDEIRVHLFRLEEILAKRLVNVHARSHGKANTLLDLVRRGEEETFESLMAGSEELRSETKASTGFRPSLRTGRSWVARLWDLSQRQSPSTLTRGAKAVANALAIPQHVGKAWCYEGCLAVLARPSERDTHESYRFARGLIVMIGGSCQFITAAAHADAYNRYPVALLTSLSYDLRKSLTTAENVLTVVDIDI